MLKQVEDISVPQSRGLNTQLNFLALRKEESPNMMDVRVYYDGSIEERLGSNTQNAVIIANSAAAGFSTNSTGTLTNSLKSFWKLDEASGSRLDIFGGVTLLDSGGTSYSGGIKNQAALFNASTGQCLYAENPAGLTNNSLFSINSWIYLNSTSPTIQRTIVSKRDQGAGTGVVSLLHMDGTNGSTTFTDSELTPKTFTPHGSVQISTAQSKFGGASGLFNGTTDYLSTPNHADFQFGTGDFTIDMWIRWNGSVSNPTAFYAMNAGAAGGCLIQYAGNITVALGTNSKTFAWSPVADTWYHLAVVRQSGNLMVFINGTQIGTTQADSTNVNDGSSQIQIGAHSSGPSQFHNGWIDELRVMKGVAAYTASFNPPTSAYTNPSNGSEFEYWLYVDTDNKATFSVSSSGIAINGEVKASSFGALTTATWYNVVAWADTNSNNQIGISVNLATNSASYTNGILTSSASYTVGAISNGAAYFMDGREDEIGYWNKILTRGERQDLYNGGSASTYQNAFDTQPWACFDFGASSLRWLTVAAGTGLYASSNLGVSFVNIATDRSATYQYLERSKNVLVATSDNYDTPLYWAGSAGTFAAMLNSSAPLCKYSINFQGFLILLNSNTRKRGFFYNDENTQLTGAWTNNFDIPSSYDDEITAAFVLRRYLYISTRYSLYRVSYVGGNPDWSFALVKNWGFIPRTVKKIILANNQPGGGFAYSIGEVAMGLTWDRKVRIFDGSGDQIVSNNIERDNGQCDFALEKISYLGSGPIISHAEVDPNQNVYKLCVAIGQDSTKTTHFINYDGRAFAWYPYSNMNFNCMVMAESANRRFLMAFDRSGYCHMMDSGNLDGNSMTVNGMYDSLFIFEKSPSQSHKGHRTDLFFATTTAGNIIYSDRNDGSSLSFTQRKVFALTGSENKVIHYESVDVPEMYNLYQFRISHQASTKDPWRLLRWDHYAHGYGLGKND